MLCSNCASIDLADAFGPDLDSPEKPLLGAHTFSPRIFHYGTYAGILSAAESCELCALVVKGFDAPLTIRPSLEEQIYRSVEREERGKDLFPGQSRRLTTLKFGGQYHGMSFDFDGLDYCEVELFVQEGKFHDIPGGSLTRIINS